MKGLLLKDFYNLRPQLGSYAIVLVFYAVISFMNNSYTMFGAMLGTFSLLLPLTSMALDERSGWEKYALSLPIKRRDIVLSRYLYSMLLCILVFLITASMGAFLGAGAVEALSSAAGSAGISLFYISLLLPFCFHMGVEKARIIMMIIFLLPAGVIIALSQIKPLSMTLSGIDEGLIVRAATAAPFIAIVVMLLSARLSLFIYNKKEF